MSRFELAGFQTVIRKDIVDERERQHDAQPAFNTPASDWKEDDTGHLLCTNSTGLDQDCKGLRIVANKRFSKKWLMLASYTYGKATQVNTYAGQYGVGQLNNHHT